MQYCVGFKHLLCRFYTLFRKLSTFSLYALFRQFCTCSMSAVNLYSVRLTKLKITKVSGWWLLQKFSSVFSVLFIVLKKTTVSCMLQKNVQVNKCYFR